MGLPDRILPEQVHDPITFSHYVQQTCGTPSVTGKDIAQLRSACTRFFEQNPELTWATLCRVAQWARAKRKRPGKVYTILAMVNWAWTDGYLPELDPSNRIDEDIETSIYSALEVETDPLWRTQLIGATGQRARREVLDLWNAQRKVLA